MAIMYGRSRRTRKEKQRADKLAQQLDRLDQIAKSSSPGRIILRKNRSEPNDKQASTSEE